MAWPPPIPPATRTNTTPQLDDHVADHNQTSGALAEIVDRLSGIETARTVPPSPTTITAGTSVYVPGTYQLWQAVGFDRLALIQVRAAVTAIAPTPAAATIELQRQINGSGGFLSYNASVLIGGWDPASESTIENSAVHVVPIPAGQATEFRMYAAKNTASAMIVAQARTELTTLMLPTP